MHTIRLRRPWKRFIDHSGDPDNVDVPDQTPLSAQPGTTLTYRRAFNRPTGLSPSDKVWLSVVQKAASSIQIVFNESIVFESETSNPIRVNISDQLQPSNQIAIRLTSCGESPALLDGQVALEIETG